MATLAKIHQEATGFAIHGYNFSEAVNLGVMANVLLKNYPTMKLVLLRLALKGESE